MNDFFKYYWHDGDIEKIEISSNQINIVILLEDYDNPITLICHDTVGLTGLCMWEDTIINNATLESVGSNIPPFSSRSKKCTPTCW